MLALLRRVLIPVAEEHNYRDGHVSRSESDGITTLMRIARNVASLVAKGLMSNDS